jgi:hypothetical protein
MRIDRAHTDNELRSDLTTKRSTSYWRMVRFATGVDVGAETGDIGRLERAFPSLGQVVKTYSRGMDCP